MTVVEHRFAAFCWSFCCVRFYPEIVCTKGNFVELQQQTNLLNFIDYTASIIQITYLYSRFFLSLSLFLSSWLSSLLCLSFSSFSLDLLSLSSCLLSQLPECLRLRPDSSLRSVRFPSSLSYLFFSSFRSGFRLSFSEYFLSLSFLYFSRLSSLSYLTISFSRRSMRSSFLKFEWYIKLILLLSNYYQSDSSKNTHKTNVYLYHYKVFNGKQKERLCVL